MKECLIRLAPAVSFELVRSDAAHRDLFENLHFPPGDPPPVVVDHHADEVIGSVLEVYTWRDPVLGSHIHVPWLIARCRLDEDGTNWIHRGVGASISTIGGLKGELGGWPVRRGPFLRHVAICAETVPVEPWAQVLLVRDVEPVTVAGEGRLLRRDLGEVVRVR